MAGAPELILGGLASEPGQTSPDIRTQHTYSGHHTNRKGKPVTVLWLLSGGKEPWGNTGIIRDPRGKIHPQNLERKSRKNAS
jgi:hypothetical protein